MPRMLRRRQGPGQDAIVAKETRRLGRLDATNHVVLGLMAAVQAGRVRQVERERTRAGATAPPPPDLVRAHRALADRLHGRAERAKIRAPRIDERTITVHGRVLDERHRGLRDVEASLVGPDGKPIVRARTDTRGYYRLDRKVDERPPRPEAPDDLVLVLTQGARELHREPTGDLAPGEARYREHRVR